MASPNSPTPQSTNPPQISADVSPKADQAPPKRASKPPPGYKFVKVRKPDGTIVTVKRKMSPEELEASQSKEAQISQPQAQSTTNGNSAQTTGPVSPIVAASTPASPTKSVASDGNTLQPDSIQGTPSQAALDEQAFQNRENRMSRFRDSMIRGLATVVSHAVPTVEIGDWHHDDEVVNHEDDPSDDEFEDHEEHDNQDEKPGHQDSSERTTTGNETQLQTGAVANALAAAATSRPAPQSEVQPGPQAVPNANVAGNKGDVKPTYNINIKELNKIEQERTENERPLKRHWANFSFYFMASLSIVLPFLFMVLAVAICLMNKKPVHSDWHKVEDAIKFAISAWPIVFAAVVAQVFKSIATFKVERGIKLIELEQLVGSNSFGSAMKQPFVLRRLDVVTLGLFLVWCLSPLGSQGLQRAFGKDKNEIHDKQDVWYLNTNGYNPMFSANASLSASGRDLKLQIVAAYYMSAFLPSTMRDLTAGNPYQDRYDNPHIMIPHVPAKYEYQNRSSVSAYGVPINLPEATFKFKNGNQTRFIDHMEDVDWDEIEFKMSGSYYNFTCENWSLKRFNDLSALVHLSDNKEFGIGMTDKANAGTPKYRPNYLAFASQNRNALVKDASVNASQEYSVMECTFDRVWLEYNVMCSRLTLDNLIPFCYESDANVTRVQKGQTGQEQFLLDFSEEWVEATSVTDSGPLSTTTENYIAGGLGLDDPYQRGFDFGKFNLTNMTTTEDFQWYFGYVFNTWVGLGVCPECIDASTYNYMPDSRRTLYLTAKADRSSTGDQVYVLYNGWFGLYITCTTILLIAGIASVSLETMTVAPDVLGYVSTVARNSRYLHLPKTNSAMSGGERARTLGGVQVMMQDVKGNADVGRIALGMKHDAAQRLKPGRLYR